MAGGVIGLLLESAGNRRDVRIWPRRNEV